VQYLHFEINASFGSSDEGELSSESTEDCQRLGPAGLALHYANIIIQIYSVVSSLRFCLRRLPKIWHDLAILS
jgi:hypothetical protein